MLRLLASVTVYCFRGGTFAKFNQGSNGARTGKKFSLRFPFSRYSGYGKRECAVPLGSGASPLGGVWGGWQRIGLPNEFCWGQGRKRLEKIGKNRKRLEKDRPLQPRLVFEVVFLLIFSGFWRGFGGILGGHFRTFFENVNFVKYSVSPRREQHFSCSERPK